MITPPHCNNESICRFYPSYCEERKQYCPQGAGCKYDTRSRPHTPTPEDYRDLFVSDLISLIEWDAKHGNPELFKAVNSLKQHYKTFTVEAHDTAIRNATLDAVYEMVIGSTTCKECIYHNECVMVDTPKILCIINPILESLKMGRKNIKPLIQKKRGEP